MAAVIYLLESTVGDFGTDGDIEYQRDACLNYCREWGITEQEEFVDRGEAADQPLADREGFRRATQALGPDDQLIVAHRRRVAPESELETLESMVFGAAATLVSVSESAEYTPGGTRSKKISGLAHRMLNGTLDLVAALSFIFCFGCVTGMGASSSPMRASVAVRGWSFIALGAVVCLVYGFMEYWSGKTPAKYIVGTHVRSSDGSDLSLGQAVIRNLLRLVDFIVFGLVGLIPMLLTDDHKRFGDLLADTRVFDDV